MSLDDIHRTLESLAKRLRALETRDTPSKTMIILAEQSVAPGTPVSGRGAIYEKIDGKLYFKNSAGVEYCLTP